MTTTSNRTELSGLLADVARFYQGCLGDKAARDFLSEHDLDAELLKRLGAGYADGTLLQTLGEDQLASLADFGLIRDGRDVFTGSLVLPCKAEDGGTVGLLGIQVTPPYRETCVLAAVAGLVGAEVLTVYRDNIVLAKSLAESLVLQARGFPNVFLAHPELGIHASIAVLASCRVKRVTTFGDESFDDILVDAGIEVEHRNTRVTFESKKEELILHGTVRKPRNYETCALEKHRDFWIAHRGALTYRMSGMKAGFTTFLRVSLRAEKDGNRHVDTVDLLSSRSRTAFSLALGELVGEEPSVIGKDLMFLLDKLEAEEQTRDAAEAPAAQPLTPEQEKLGMAFLRNPELFDELSRDLDVLGYAGEEANKQVAYLVATSRLQDDPLNMLVVSGSGAGKSALIDAVRKLIPGPEVVSLTSLSDQALNYLEPEGLLNKLMILGEAVHSDTVDHQLREIVSSKELSRLVTSRDERTGKQVARAVRTPAVVSLMMSTTHRNHNPENLTRYLILHADESEEQTARIHEVQNARLSLESLQVRERVVPTVIEKHHAAQRLLRPVKVVAPVGVAWDLPVHKLRTRRDNAALNSLMVTIAFIRQFQKERKVLDGVTYIECDEWDRQKAWELFRSAVMPATYQEYPEAMGRLYDAIQRYCTARAGESNLTTVDVVFDQRSIRKAVNWTSGESVKLYIRKLVELEHLVVKSSGARGTRKTYSLAEDLSWQELEGGPYGT